MNQRPWQSDAEIEAQMHGGSRRTSFGQPQVQRPPQPVVTYSLLGTFLIVFILELIVQAARPDRFAYIFTIYADPGGLQWILFRPWSPFVSALSHGGLSHLLMNSIFLYFFGPTIENLLGRNRFIVLFFASGALSGIIQAMLEPAPALGASGALMAIIGISIVLMPKAKMIIFPFPVPIPLWVGGLGFALLDLLGVFNPSDGVGNFAHLSGMAIGLLYGWKVLQDLKKKGLRIQY